MIVWNIISSCQTRCLACVYINPKQALTADRATCGLWVSYNVELFFYIDSFLHFRCNTVSLIQFWFVEHDCLRSSCSRKRTQTKMSNRIMRKLRGDAIPVSIEKSESDMDDDSLVNSDGHAVNRFGMVCHMCHINLIVFNQSLHFIVGSRK